MTNKLDEETRKVEKSNLQTALEQALGNSPAGLTEADVDECWKLAKDYWNIKPER